MFDQNITNAFLMLAAMVGVLGGLLYLMRVLIKRSRKSSGGNGINVVSRVSLQPKTHMYVVEVEGRKLLIGATDNNVNTLADLTDEEDLSAMEEVENFGINKEQIRDAAIAQKIPVSEHLAGALSFKNFLKTTFSRS